jgi:hypothetical protein
MVSYDRHQESHHYAVDQQGGLSEPPGFQHTLKEPVLLEQGPGWQEVGK